MKKLLLGALAAAVAVCMAFPAFAEGEKEEAFTIAVGWESQLLELDGLPRQPYYQGETLMVPLARIAQALGYQVSWEPETGAVTVEDEGFQKAVLFHQDPEVVFEGYLTIIDLSHVAQYPAAPVIYQGCTYVPLEFFEEFLNTTAVDGTAISVAPEMVETQG